MAGQVSPEALFSRLQAEGSKTEVESEVRAQNIHTGYFRPHFLMKTGNFCHILASVYVETAFLTLEHEWKLLITP